MSSPEGAETKEPYGMKPRLVLIGSPCGVMED